MKWTKEQQLAIEQREKNILVAAAAGSGKTAVLVERIKKIIIDEGIPIDKMLIVTFTKAAASEMKEKIRKGINDELMECRGSAEEIKKRRFLRQQLELLPQSNISTFHSFALDVIKKFFFLSDVQPRFSIADEAQSKIMREDSLDQLLEEWFEKESSEFTEFLDWYSSDRNQDKIRDMIGSAYNSLMAMPYPWQWLDEKTDELSMNIDEFAKSQTMDLAYTLIKRKTELALANIDSARSILMDADLTRLMAKLDKEVVGYRKLDEAAAKRSYPDIFTAIDSMATVRIVPNKSEKDAYGRVGDEVKELKSTASKIVKEIRANFFSEPLESQVELINATHEKAVVFKKLLIDFHRIFNEIKREKKLIDFNDIEHYSLEILENEEAARFYSRKFEYIFIDEYQDTNLIQEEIISKIKRRNNMFMVGDIKQSIYKFRLAEPEIFKKKYTDYDGRCEDSMKIDLNKNYRSSKAIIQSINGIFENLMDGYDAAAKLYNGLEKEERYNFPVRLNVLDVSAIIAGDDELADLKSAEIEALEAVRIIKENLGRTYFDSKEGRERQLQLCDMVILMRGVKGYSQTYQQIMMQEGVETYIDDSEGYFDTMEIDIFMKLMAVIDNFFQDVPLISVLHSEIFNFSADELAGIRENFKYGSYAKAFIEYSKDGRDEQLRLKVETAYDKIVQWKRRALMTPLPAFLWELMLESGYYIYVGSLPGGNRRQGNLQALIDKGEAFASDGRGSLYDFCRYIDAVKKRNVPVGQVKLVGEKDQIVRIMTIHKSKGLEFPLVIVAGMGRRLNYTKSSREISFHKDIGIGMPVVNFEEHWYKNTLMQSIMSGKIHQEEVEEEIRVLYVALTRAKDFLYMTGTVRDGVKYRAKVSTGITGETTYLDMIGAFSGCNIISGGHVYRNEGEMGNRADSKGNVGISSEDRNELKLLMDYTYPHDEKTGRKQKYSVTELLKGDGERERVPTSKLPLLIPRFAHGEEELSSAEKGTVYHVMMEKLDFCKAADEGIAYIEEVSEQCIKSEILTQREIDSIDFEKIAKFFKSSLGRRCRDAFEKGTLQREVPFNYVMEMEGKDIIVQGIIDCFFEEGDGIVILDYKSNRIDKAKPIEQEKERIKSIYEKQLDIYAQALELSKHRKVKDKYFYLFDGEIEIRI